MTDADTMPATVTHSALPPPTTCNDFPNRLFPVLPRMCWLLCRASQECPVPSLQPHRGRNAFAPFRRCDPRRDRCGATSKS
uniref:Uncharacterized protein n=1 Tax=uncultured marine virus TaxID=186617 RepID=A0A0F7L395_9VIRU|nr:hypothetical protein [uncultured marine virus]